MSLVESQQRSLYSAEIELRGHEKSSQVLCSRFSPSGDIIASAGTDSNVILWDLPRTQLNEFSILGNHNGPVTLIRWLNEDTLASSSADCTARIWDVARGKQIRKLTAHESCVNEVGHDRENSQSILTVLDDGWACFWDYRDKNPTTEIKTDYPLILGTVQGDLVYVGGIKSTLMAFDVRKPHSLLWECEGPAGQAITSVSVGDNIIASRGLEGTITTYLSRAFVPEGIPRATSNVYVGAPLGKERQMIRIGFNSSNSKIILGSEDASVTIWDVSTRKIAKKLQGHKATTIDVDWHPSQDIVVSSSIDGSIVVWEV